MITEIKNLQPTNTLEMSWAFTNLCNYSCRYCFPGANEGDIRFPQDTKTVIKNFNSIFDFYKKYQGKDKFIIRLLGGEPTLWSELDFFIKNIKEKHNIYVSVTSNGSRTLRWWQENGHLIDNLSISYHKKFADINHIISVADTMYMLDKKVTVHVLMDPDEWDGCVNDINYMKKHSKYPWLIETKKLTPTINFLPKYNDEQNNYMKWGIKRIPSLWWFLKQVKLILNRSIRLNESVYIKNNKKHTARAETYIVNQDTNFFGYECNYSAESVHIDRDGTLKASCKQEIFKNQYNIYNREFKFTPEIEPIICSRSNCFCPADNHISKKYIKVHSV